MMVLRSDDPSGSVSGPPSEPSSGGAYYPLELAEILHSGYGQVGKIGPLKIVLIIQTFWGSATVRPWLEWTVRAYPRAQSWPHLLSRTSRAYLKGTSTTSFRTSSCWSGLPSSKGPGMVTMMFCRRVSLRRYNRGTGTSGKHFLWHCLMNSSLWARSRTFCLGVKMKSHGFQASTKRSHPRQPGSAFCTSWVLSGCRRIRFLRRGSLALWSTSTSS